MATPTPERPFEFDINQSERDGVWIIHIDTEVDLDDDHGPRLRIYLNDGDALYENPPLPPSTDEDDLPTLTIHTQE